MGKWEIAHYEQFPLFRSVFKRLVSQGRQKVSLCGNGLKGRKITKRKQILVFRGIPFMPWQLSVCPPVTNWTCKLNKPFTKLLKLWSLYLYLARLLTAIPTKWGSWCFTDKWSCFFLFSIARCSFIATWDSWVNPLPNDKILDVTKLKAFADDKLKVGRMMIVLLEDWKTLWEKEKMLVTSIFSFSHSVFQSVLL